MSISWTRQYSGHALLFLKVYILFWFNQPYIDNQFYFEPDPSKNTQARRAITICLVYSNLGDTICYITITILTKTNNFCLVKTAL